MSLKAKLEAVIYAAEEPVTLAQLAALFADEALEWKAEQEPQLRRVCRGRHGRRTDCGFAATERGVSVPGAGACEAAEASAATRHAASLAADSDARKCRDYAYGAGR